MFSLRAKVAQVWLKVHVAVTVAETDWGCHADHWPSKCEVDQSRIFL